MTRFQELHESGEIAIATEMILSKIKGGIQTPATICVFCLFFSGLEGSWGFVRCCQFDLPVLIRTRGTLRLQPFGISFYFCLLFSGLEGSWGSNCRVLSVRFVCSFRVSWDPGAPAVGYCFFFWLFLSGLEGSWGSNCQISSVLPVCSRSASRDPGALAVGYCLLLSGLEGSWARAVGCFLIVSFIPSGASRDPRAPAVGY